MQNCRTRWGGGAVLAAIALNLGLVAETQAQHTITHRPYSTQSRVPLVRGEVARQQRQAYDYYYRNSNRNVFRSSRHFSPTQNVFRRSRHYQRRLAASYAGYPLRTTVRYTEHTSDGPVERSFSYAYPRRHPTGPVGFGLESQLYPYAGGRSVGFDDGYRLRDGDCRDDGYQSGGPILILPERQETPQRADIEMVKISNGRPTQHAVLSRVMHPDGTVRTIITSEPLDEPEVDTPSLDRAWRLMKVGDYSRASEAFLDLSEHQDLGAQAMLGYALTRAAVGENEGALNALNAALLADPLVLEQSSLTDAWREMLQELRGASAENVNSSPELE